MCINSVAFKHIVFRFFKCVCNVGLLKRTMILPYNKIIPVSKRWWLIHVILSLKVYIKRNCSYAEIIDYI